MESVLIFVSLSVSATSKKLQNSPTLSLTLWENFYIMSSSTKSIFRMIPEIKAFFESPLTKSLNVQITRDDFPHNEIIYTLTNGAIDLKIIVHSTLGQDDTNSLQIYTKPSEKLLKFVLMVMLITPSSVKSTNSKILRKLSTNLNKNSYLSSKFLVNI